jgi:hypothetical protein
MTTFYSRQRDRAQPAYKKANADTFNFASQIASPIYTVMHTKRVKTDATSFESRCSRTVLRYRFYMPQALPLVWTRFLRLAKNSPKTARSPARQSRDGREPSGKKSGEISRVISAQRPGDGRTVATAMLLNVRQDDSQDNLPCAGLGRAMSAPGTCETTRKMVTQQPRRNSRNGQRNILQEARRILIVSFQP